jgi:predicted TIM-barrel fold metal-dependent hydrolase
LEFPTHGAKPLTVESFDTARHLAHAARQARERDFNKLTIVDCDLHHDETTSFRDIVGHIDSTVERQLARSGTNEGRRPLIPRNIGYEDIGGRMQRFAARRLESGPANVHRDITLTTRTIEAMGAKYGVLYPTTAMRLAIQPKRDWEYWLTLAYNRWIATDLLAQETRLRGMLYLPLHHHTECLEMVEQLGDKPGIAGCVVSSPRYERIHAKGMLKILAAMEERGLVLAFHGMANWSESSLSPLPQWGAVQALGVPHSNMVHLTNWMVNGMPERFPKLKVLWLESGVAWANYLMQRLDAMYMARISESPLLKEKPSHYMKRMFYCSQPLERPEDPQALEVAFRAIDAETQLVWGSNFPSHDFDVPATVYDLPFLSDTAKAAILGGNALKLFGIDPTKS